MSNSFTFRADADLSTVIRTVAASRSEPVSVLIRKAIRSTVVDEITASEIIRRGLAAYDPGSAQSGLWLTGDDIDCGLPHVTRFS